MDTFDARSLGVLNIEQLIAELNFLPAGDSKVEAKFGESKADCFAPQASAWLDRPLPISIDLAGAY